LAFGPAAQRLAPLPPVDATVALDYGTRPDYRGLAAAVGGGPLLVAGGAPAVDPDAPAPEERDVRFPVAGAAVDAAGTLYLIAVDGRVPQSSIGLTRPEFGALMRGFGATGGLAFDSGGSATLVARSLGDAAAAVVNVPSDGVERPVADGLFVYSDAPRGVDPHLIVRPSGFSALAGTAIPLAGTVVDDAGNRLASAALAPLRPDPSPGPHLATVAAPDGMTAQVPYRTIERVAGLAISPSDPNPAPFGSVVLRARGLDADGGPVVLGPVAWLADRGTLVPAGDGASYRAVDVDGTVSASAAGATATVVVRVGSHPVALAAFAHPGGGWRFAALPGNGPGGLLVDGEEVELDYDFSGSARAAYADATLPLPGDPLAFRLDVLGDGGGAALRGSFVNRYGEKELLTLARQVDWRGWRTITIPLPPSLNAPVTLTSLYVLPALGGPPIHVAGSLRFRAAAALVRGSS
jgi:hypothetical protein